MPCRCLLHAEHLLDDFIYLRLLERTELAHTERSETQQRLLRAAQDRVGVALGLVVGPEEKYSLALDLAGHKMQQLERRRVGPLKILEYDKERLLGRESAEKLGEVP